MLALGISDTITSFGIYIVSLIYGLVADLFQVFVVLAKANTIDSNLYNNLVNNFYLLLAVIMLFIVAFSLLKTMVSPDDSKGADTSGKVVKNFVTSVIILAFLPTIFSFAFSFQNAIINYNTIGKIFGGGGIYDSDAQNATEAAGFQMSNGVFLAFFTPTKCEGEISKCREEITANAGMFSKVKDLLDGDKDSQYTFEGAVNYVNAKGKFSIYTDFSEAVNEGDISFNFIVSLIAGCYLLYVVLSFCLDLGFRLVRLIFYQIIAPIPIFLRIVPDAKNDTFGKWVSITFACYIEVFLRLFIIYFGIYLVSILPKAILGTGVDGLTGGKWLLANAIIILGVITFIKESPKLIGGIFGDSANMSLGLKDKLKTGGLFGFGAAGAAVGSFIASKGSISAMKRGWKNGFKNIGAEAERNKLKSDAIASGVSRTDIMKDSFRKKMGFNTQAEAEKSKIEEGTYAVKNESLVGVNYQDKAGNTKSIGVSQSANITQTDIDDMALKKAENIQKISAQKDQIKALDVQASSGSARIKHKSNIKSEAEKKIDEAGSEAVHTIIYGTGSNDTFTGTYSEIVNFKNNSLSKSQIEYMNSNDQTDDKIRDAMIKEFVDTEYAKSDSKIKQDMNSGFVSIQNNGGYEFKYEDANHNIHDYKIQVTKNGNDWTAEAYDQNGQVVNIGLQNLTNYDLVSKIDKLAKSSNGIINMEKQNIQEQNIDAIEAENSAIDDIAKQFNDAKDALLKSASMRQKEAAGKYVANSNK